MTWISDIDRWLSESESLANAQLVADHFSATGWTPNAIAALCGNMRKESSINPNVYEYGYNHSLTRGYGLVQWTPASKYIDWANARGLAFDHGDSQLARLDYEQEQKIQWITKAAYPISFHDFTRSTLDPEYLTECFLWNYERPRQDAGIESTPERKAFAMRVFQELLFQPGGGKSKPAWPTTPGLPITSPYGWRLHPIEGIQKFHGAIDIGGGGVNHPVYATQDGMVIYNQSTSYGGWTIRLKHTADPYYSQYQHMATQSPISIGATVKKGQVIGTMGTTGDSTGIHLDFAIATNESGWFTEAGTIDPVLYLDMLFGSGPEDNTIKIATNRHNTNMRRRIRI